MKKLILWAIPITTSAIVVGSLFIGMSGPNHTYPYPLPPLHMEVLLKAEAGDPTAQIQMGNWLKDGTLGIVDIAEAETWFRSAMDSGDKDAGYRLFFLLYDTNKNEALKALEISAIRGNLEAQLLMADSAEHLRPPPGSPPNIEKDRESARWRLAAAENGDALSQFVYGTYALRGAGGMEQNSKVAAHWLEKASRQGNPTAQVFLAELFAEGNGVPQNLVMAHVWANIAASTGDEYGKDLRDRLAQSMTAEQIARAQETASRCQRTGFSECE